MLNRSRIGIKSSILYFESILMFISLFGINESKVKIKLSSPSKLSIELL